MPRKRRASVHGPSLRALSASVLSLLVAACAGDKKDKDSYVEAPVEKLYNDATDDLVAGRYQQASKLYDEVDRQHPYSVWATKAQLMAAYAQYQTNKYDDAIGGFDRFISLHPGNRDAPYAFYMKALCYYEQIEDVGRDQAMTQKALDSLTDVIRRFPDSNYARDARVKLDLTRDHLAGKEMEIGRYYLKRGEYVAAINRFRSVVERYQQTTHVPEALERLTESYLALGIPQEAQTAAAVLGYNYPGSRWYQDSYAMLEDQNLAPAQDRGSWISKAWGAVF